MVGAKAKCGRRVFWLMILALPCHGHAADGEAMDFRLEKVRLEYGHFFDQPDANGNAFAHGAISAGGASGAWEYALGFRFDGFAQYGGRDTERNQGDYTENFLRWRSDDARLTVGTQKIMWGRVDEVSPIDRMSRADLTRGIMDKLPERRRALPAARVEYFGEGSKIDAVWLPVFDDAEMPSRRSVWSPVNTIDGRLLGFGSVPLVVGAKVKNEEGGSGGGGVRYTVEGDGADYGFSVQRVRQSQPYYRFTPGVLRAMHPFSTVVGAEFETERFGATWRVEAAWSSDVPTTSSDTLSYRTARGGDLVLGTEVFPGDGETRLTLQLAAHKTFDSPSVLDRTEIYALVGELEYPFAQGRWRADLRFLLGLDERDIYVNPKLTFLGVDGHELFLAAHIFTGSAQTIGGFYKNNDVLMAGWQASF